MTRPVRGLADAVRVGERVFLRLPARRDLEEAMALRRRSYRRLRPWEPTPPKGVDPLADDWFERWVSFRRSATHRKLALCLRSDGAIVGGCSLNEIVRGALQGCFAGWWIGDPYEGHGYMREGLALLLDHAFLDLKLHRVEANIRPENERSKRTAKALGLRCEGYSPRYLEIAGAWRDHERWAILAEEWRTRRPLQPGGAGSSRRTATMKRR